MESKRILVHKKIPQLRSADGTADVNTDNPLDYASIRK